MQFSLGSHRASTPGDANEMETIIAKVNEVITARAFMFFLASPGFFVRAIRISKCKPNLDVSIYPLGTFLIASLDRYLEVVTLFVNANHGADGDNLA